MHLRLPAAVLLRPASIAVATVLLLAGCASDDRPAAYEQIPLVVREGFRARYPGADIQTTTEERLAGVPYYLISADGTTAPVTAIFSADGKLAAMTLPLPPVRLPPAVKEAATRTSPNGEIRAARITQRPTGTAFYSVEIVEGGRTRTASFESSGSSMGGR